MSTESKYKDRTQKAVQVAAPGRVQQARQNGPHGSAGAVHTDGSHQSDKNPHHAPLRGVNGDDKGNSESYRPNRDGKKIPAEGHPDSSPSFGSKEMKNGEKVDLKEPQPAGETHGGSTVPFESTKHTLLG